MFLTIVYGDRHLVCTCLPTDGLARTNLRFFQARWSDRNNLRSGANRVAHGVRCILRLDQRHNTSDGGMDCAPGLRRTERARYSRQREPCGARFISGSRESSVCERIGAKLHVHGARHASLAAFLEPRRAVTVRAPQPASLPAGVRIVDTPVDALRVEADRVRDADRDHLAVLQRDEAVIEVGGGHRSVLAEPERVVLVDPGVIARLPPVLADAFETWSRVLVERPALRTMIAGRSWPVERALALATVEAAKMAAR